MRLKVGDKVIVIAGSNKGKIGKVNKFLSKENKVIVEGVNLVKKHKKADGQNQTGGIVEFEAPFHSSNVMLLDPKTGKGTRKKVVQETTKEAPKKATKKETKVSKKTSVKNDK